MAEDIILKICAKKKELTDKAIFGTITEIVKDNECLVSIDVNETAIVNALKKQIPKKPILKYHKEDVTPVKYGRLIEFLCPNCGRFIVATYETDAERGGGIHRDLKGCSTCLQAIDFTGYYHIDDMEEEIELE